VLGIDAAWTETHLSGVAAVVEEDGRWRLKRAAESYEEFCKSREPADLLQAAKEACKADICVVAVDMPLSRLPIEGRRASDIGVSKEYGSKWAATHSPSKARPGKVSDELRAGFEANGFPLRTEDFEGRGLIEVYPHPALIEFMRAEKRLPYKEGKRASYWKNQSRDERREKLLGVWRTIVNALEREITGVQEAMQLPPPGLKAFEDKLDAIICAAVGVAVLEGRARTIGDEDSAIWIPTSSSTRRQAE